MHTRIQIYVLTSVMDELIVIYYCLRKSVPNITILRVKHMHNTVYLYLKVLVDNTNTSVKPFS